MFPKPRVIKHMKRKLLSEVIKTVQDAKRRADKVNILESNMCPALVGILRMNYDETLELDIDPEITYRPRRELDVIETLNHSSKMWKSFTKESIIPKTKKNLRLKSMLERLEPREAALFLDAANRRINLGISKMVIKKCFPHIFK
jgi:hypothetical protein